MKVTSHDIFMELDVIHITLTLNETHVVSTTLTLAEAIAGAEDTPELTFTVVEL